MRDPVAFGLAVAGTLTLGALLWRIARNSISEWERVAWLLRVVVILEWSLFYWHQAFRLDVLTRDGMVTWSRYNFFTMICLFVVTLIARWRT